MIVRPRPVVRWHGGKWLLAPWIISHFPPHQVYTESYGGGASVLLRKPPAYAEIYNDLDGEIVNVFAVLRGDRAGELVEQLRMTPFARAEFELAYHPADDPVERARRMIVRSFMGHGSNGHSRSTGFRANSNRSGSTPAHDWRNYPDALILAIERFRGVIVENRAGRDVMAAHDSPECLHYVDPPYVESTRGDSHMDYAVELSDDDHAALLDFLGGLAGMVVLSGYRSVLYDDALTGWARFERAALADGARKRVECLWLNPAAAAAMPSPLLNLIPQAIGGRG